MSAGPSESYLMSEEEEPLVPPGSSEVPKPKLKLALVATVAVALVVTVTVAFFGFGIGTPSTEVPATLTRTVALYETEPEQVFKILDKYFAGIPAGGGNVRSNLQQLAAALTPQDEKLENTAAFACSAVDFSSFSGSGASNEAVQAIMKKLQLEKWCGLKPGGGESPHDPTCRAFWAGMAAHIELQDRGVKPVFKNMEVHNWFQNRPGHFPSWGSKGGVSVRYRDGKLQGAEVHNKNAVSAYAFCDIVYTILKQNFDQAQRGQCGPTAVLVALSHSNPAGAIKLGLQLYWTGFIPSIWRSQWKGCGYIYHDVPPGVVPFKPYQPGTEGSRYQPLRVDCTGNSHDCANARGTPNTNGGLQGMFAIKMASVRDQIRAQGSCHFQALKAWVQYPGMPSSRKVSDPFSWPAMETMMAQVFGRQHRHKLFQGNYFGDPRDEQALHEICSNKWGAVVGMAAGILNAAIPQRMGMSASNPFKLLDSGANYECKLDHKNKSLNNGDHMVYIDECQGESVSIWTWTGRVFITKKALLAWGNTDVCKRVAPHDTRSALKGYILVPPPEGNLTH